MSSLCCQYLLWSFRKTFNSIGRIQPTAFHEIVCQYMLFLFPFHFDNHLCIQPTISKDNLCMDGFVNEVKVFNMKELLNEGVNKVFRMELIVSFLIKVCQEFCAFSWGVHVNDFILRLNFSCGTSMIILGGWLLRLLKFAIVSLGTWILGVKMGA